MAWIESHQSLSRHRKTLKTAGRLSVDRHKLIGHLHELWWWALDNVGVDGRLTGMSPVEIGLAAQWDGDPEEFVEALIYGGFIDRDGDELVLHDWYDYAGKLMEQRAKERERSRKRRAEQRRRPLEKDRGSTAGRPEDDREKTVGTVPNRTVPNSTNNKEYTCAPDDAQEDTHDAPMDKPSSKSGPRSPFKSKRQEQLFDEFWERYPKKRSKGQAERAWAKITPDDALFRYILDGLERAKRSRDWIKDAGAYIPYPATWLNAKGWEDEHDERGIGNDRHGSKSKFDELIIRDDDI